MIIEKNEMKIERRARIQEEKHQQQKALTLQKQHLISRLTRRDSMINNADPDAVDSIQNVKLQQMIKKKQQQEKLLKEISKDQDLDQYKFQSDDMKFPYTLRESLVTAQVLKDYDNQLKNERERYSSIKRSARLLNVFGGRSSSLPISSIFQSQLSSQALLSQQQQQKKSHHRHQSADENEQDQQSKELKYKLGQELAFIRNTLHQKDNDFQKMLRMVETMKEFFPIQKVIENERNFQQDARCSISDFDQLKELTQSRLTFVDQVRNKRNHGNNLQNTKQIKSLIQKNANPNFLDTYKLNINEINGDDKFAYLKQLQVIREEEKKQQMIQKNIYQNNQHPHFDDSSSEEGSPLLYNGDQSNESIVKETFQNFHQESTKNFINQLPHEFLDAQTPITKIKITSNNLQPYQSTPLNMYTSSEQTFLSSPASQRIITKRAIQKKGSQVLLSSIHDDPLVQSIITNGQIKSFAKVKRNKLKSDARLSTLNNSPSTRKIAFAPDHTSDSKLSNNCLMFDDLHKLRLEKRLQRKLNSLLKKANVEMPLQTLNRAQLHKQLLVLQKLNKDEQIKIQAHNLNISSCLIDIGKDSPKKTNEFNQQSTGPSPLFSEEYYDKKYSAKKFHSRQASDFVIESKKQSDRFKNFVSTQRQQLMEHIQQTEQQIKSYKQQQQLQATNSKSPPKKSLKKVLTARKLLSLTKSPKKELFYD